MRQNRPFVTPYFYAPNRHFLSRHVGVYFVPMEVPKYFEAIYSRPDPRFTLRHMQRRRKDKANAAYPLLDLRYNCRMNTNLISKYNYIVPILH